MCHWSGPRSRQSAQARYKSQRSASYANIGRKLAWLEALFDLRNKFHDTDNRFWTASMIHVCSSQILANPVTLVPVHGPGRDENSLLSLRNQPRPGAALLGLRRTVLENGMLPSFRRFTEPGLSNVRSRTKNCRNSSARFRTIRVQHEKTGCGRPFQWCKPRSQLDSASSTLPCTCGSLPSDGAQLSHSAFRGNSISYSGHVYMPPRVV
jgi:hypothetical protein